jgi:DNA-binding NarL/FixJ family response regulator
MPGRAVIVIESNAVGWDDLCRIVGLLPGVRIVGRAASAPEALRLLTDVQPDAIISAPRLADGPALPLLREIRARLPACILVVASARADLDVVLSLAGLGLAGQLVWSELSSAALRDALAAALSGEVLVASRTPAEAFREVLQNGPQRMESASPLSKREQEILSLIANGVSDAAIAKRLQRAGRGAQTGSRGIAISTVESRVERICRKLDAENRCHAVAIAARRGIIE